MLQISVISLLLLTFSKKIEVHSIWFLWFWPFLHYLCVCATTLTFSLNLSETLKAFSSSSILNVTLGL